MTRARALRTVPWVQSIFAPRSGFHLWRSAALTGSALDELAFSRVEIGAVPLVAVAGDISADDG